jgi:ADP-ribose pyrophosphatase
VDRFRLPDGSISEQDVVLHPGAAAVLPVLRNGRTLLVRQHRYAVGKSLWEIPAGKLEPDEVPLECARRELREETGHDAPVWEDLASFYTSPGFTDERMTLFLAQDAFPVAPGIDTEIAACRAFGLTEILCLLEDDEIEDAKTILGLDVLRLRRGPRP